MKPIGKYIVIKTIEEEIPTTANNNPIFARDVNYNHKVYKRMILEMNQSIKQQRHLSLE